MHVQTAHPRFSLVPLLLSVALTLAVGFVASVFTRPEIAGWYASLQKPTFNPPNGVFAPVWTTLYVLIGISAYMIWQRRAHPVFKAARLAYFIQLFLNFSWSIVFFGLHQISGGLIIIVLLVIAIGLTILRFAAIHRPAAWLLVPYMAWVTFATVLNLSIWFLN